LQNVALPRPNQKRVGAATNVSGAGMLKYRPHKDDAHEYLEYLASAAAQPFFAIGNNEWPAVAGAAFNSRALEALGKFNPDTLNVNALGKTQPVALKVFARAGFK
jgi:iron(III) transport system substrate-binding protein